MDDLPKRWPLVTNPGNRYANVHQDGRLVNCFAEKDLQMDEYDVLRRPGIRPHADLVATFSTNEGRGMFNWRPDFSTNFLMQVRDALGVAHLFKDTTDLGAVFSGYYDAFEPVQSATPTMFFKSGGNAYVTDGTTITAVGDAAWLSFQADVLPGAASLNGRLYVLAAPDRVYGAASLDTGTSWSTLNLIRANDNPDWGTYICRYLQYILVMKQYTTEVFQDEGNPTGSPLGRVQGVSIPYGCMRTDCVVRINDDLFWPATSRNTAQDTVMTQVVRMRGLVAEPVSTPMVDRLLSTYTPTRAFPLLIMGHKLYCLELYTGSEYFHLVYDVTEGLWSEWYIPARIVAAQGGPYGLVLQIIQGTPLQILESLTHDTVNTDIVPISADIYTPNMDFGADRIKYLGALYFTGDETQGTTMEVRHTDDDYKTWSNFRTVDLSKVKPRITDEGSFYSRAYHLRFKQAGPFRQRSMGLQMGLGVL